MAVEARHATAHLPAIGTVLLNTTAAEARQLLMLSDERAAGNGDSVQEVKVRRCQGPGLGRRRLGTVLAAADAPSSPLAAARLGACSPGGQR